MIPTIFCVRIGDKYGVEHEDYIESKLVSIRMSSVFVCDHNQIVAAQ